MNKKTFGKLCRRFGVLILFINAIMFLKLCAEILTVFSEILGRGGEISNIISITEDDGLWPYIESMVKYFLLAATGFVIICLPDCIKDSTKIKHQYQSTTNLPETKICENCYSEVSQSNKFCPKCGSNCFVMRQE